jgi:SAM-dependent methyltransferase
VTSLCLPDTYVSRWPVAQHDAWTADEAYQDSVYALAAPVLKQVPGGLVVDWGCGSGRKMAKYFRTVEVIGVELHQHIARLEREHPSYAFATSALRLSGLKADVLLLADVIEHVENPRAFLPALLQGLEPKVVVISTPAREHIVGGSLTGPPTNPCHAREWTMPEFAEFIGQFLTIDEHTLIDPPRATQCIVGRPK